MPNTKVDKDITKNKDKNPQMRANKKITYHTTDQ